MPWRRRSKMLDQLIAILEERKQPLQQMQLLGLIELMVERILSAARVILVLAVILLVVVIPGAAYLERQIQHNSDNQVQTKKSADKSTASALETRMAVQDVKDILGAALNPDNASAQASADAIDRIKAIEIRICGGPCPRPTTTSTTPKG